MVSTVLRFPGDRLAAFTCSFGAHENSASSNLWALTLFFMSNQLTTTRTTCGGRSGVVLAKRKKTFPKGDQFAAEMDYFSQCVMENREPEPSGAEGLADIRIIRAIDEAARRGRTVKLKPLSKTKRPGPRQEIKRPPVKRQPHLRSLRLLLQPMSASSLPYWAPRAVSGVFRDFLATAGISFGM